MIMKKTFRTGTVVIGEGVPKICVPVVAGSRDGIWKKAEEIASLPVDIVEWRADFYEQADRPEEVRRTLGGLRERLGEKALLFTFRTKGEGGQREAASEYYYRLNEAAALGGADLVDVEAYFDRDRERTAAEIGRLQSRGCRVIGSSHDFDRTPPTDEMVKRLRYMEALGADAVKLAVMPAGREDVLRLLEATIRADAELSVPVVTMSMGWIGLISRLCGSLTGSAMTFASVGKASAPGQIPAEQMTEALALLGYGG